MAAAEGCYQCSLSPSVINSTPQGLLCGDTVAQQCLLIKKYHRSPHSSRALTTTTGTMYLSHVHGGDRVYRVA